MDLAPSQALAIRMTSLLLRDVADGVPLARTADVAGVVTWFGAMQAQDAASGVWSLGARLPKLTALDVHAALERREAVRTWPMRGTVHLVPPRDARWMLELMGPRVIAGSASRRAGLGISDRTADRAAEVLATALAGGGRMTRAECLAALADAGIAIDGQRGYHLLAYASLRAVTCIPDALSRQTYVLLDEWAPEPHLPDRDEALATIAVRYFRSHGPTTRQDFAGWTGLTATDARRGIAVAGERLTLVLVDGQAMFVDPAVLDSVRPGADDVLLALPGFDEYLLGYKDRTLMLDAEHKQAIIPGGNGIFQPTIVRGGRVIGTWKRSGPRGSAQGRTAVTVRPLVTLSAQDRVEVEQALAPYGRFTGRRVDVTWT
jgi:hypothetical protein